MLSEFLHQMRPFFGDEEREMISQYNFEDGFLTEFKETVKFEKKLSAILGVTSTVAVNNGTIALSIAGIAVGIKPGDEVIIPNFTMIATPNSMKLIGAKPIFADIEVETWCLSRDEIFKKITPRTKGVILVSANGRYPSYDVDLLREELNNQGIFLIEDAAQSLGSLYPDGTAIGTKGNVATLSFSAPKIISTGQGGIVFSRFSDIAEKARRVKDFGREQGGSDVHDSFGINSKFTDLQALVGLAQLNKLETRKIRRKEQHQLYTEHLKDCDAIRLPKNDNLNTVPWFTEVIVKNRDLFIQVLKKNNIGTRPVYPEINKQKIYDENINLHNSKIISHTGLWLPSHMGVTNFHIEYICNILKSCALETKA